MSWRFRFSALAIAATCLLGCAPSEVRPEEIVRQYFHSLARDPLRNLDLLTPAFHLRHGLRPLTSKEAQALQRGTAPTRPSGPSGSDVESVQRRVNAARTAWLMVQIKPEFRRIAAGLVVGPAEREVSAKRAKLSVRVAPASGPDFFQHFRLVRDGSDRPWRIDQIEQRAVVRDNLSAAVVAYPNLQHQRRLLGARP